LPPEGNYIACIESVKENVTPKGYDRWNVTFSLKSSMDNTYIGNAYKDIIFLPEHPEITNQYLGLIYDSFSIPEQRHPNYLSWIGHVGAVAITHEKYQGKTYAEVMVLPKIKQAELGLNVDGEVLSDLPDLPDSTDSLKMPF